MVSEMASSNNVDTSALLLGSVMGCVAGTVLIGPIFYQSMIKEDIKARQANDIILPGALKAEQVSSLLDKGYVTKGQFQEAAAQGVDRLVTTLSKVFSASNTAQEAAREAAQKAVTDYLAGDKEQPPVITAPAAAPAAPAPAAP